MTGPAAAGQDRIVDGKYIVSALAQGIAVLQLFSRARPVLTAPQVAQELDLPRATVFRLLRTLEATGFLQRGSDERQFKLGPAILTAGFEYLASLDLVEAAQPILQRLRDETGLSSHMAVRDGREIVYVARYPARTTLSSPVNIGTRFAAHATVMGRMLLCNFSDEQLRELFPREPLPRFTDQTPTTRAALKAILAEDHARGYAVSQSFFERGVSAIAAPVRDRAGLAVAAINVTAIDAYIDLDTMHGALKDAVLRAASEISQWIQRGEARAVEDRDAHSSAKPKPRIETKESTNA